MAESDRILDTKLDIRSIPSFYVQIQQHREHLEKPQVEECVSQFWTQRTDQLLGYFWFNI